MAFPLLIVAGGVAAAITIAGFVRSLTQPGEVTAAPGLTPAQFRESEIELESFGQVFRQEESLRLESLEAERFEIARQRREEDLRRQARERQEDQRREDAAAFARQSREVELLIEADRLARIRRDDELEFARQKLLADRALDLQSSQARSFEAFARNLPKGSTPVLRADGTFTALPPGSTLTVDDIRAGADPVAFSPRVTTASRITTVPGVFVGANFRFKTIVDAQSFLLEAAIKAKEGRGRSVEGVRTFSNAGVG